MSWDRHSIPLLCVPPNSLLLRLRPLRSLDPLNQFLSPTGRRSGHANRIRKALPGQISSRNRMGRCAARLAISCMPRSVDRNAMARCGYSMPRGSAIAAPVRCASAVKNLGQPSNHVVSAPCSGQSPNHLLNLPPHRRLLPLLTRSCGKIGVGARHDASGWLCCAPKPSPSASFPSLLLLTHKPAARSPDGNERIGDFRGQSDWPAMLARLVHLRWSFAFLGFPPPLPPRWVWLWRTDMHDRATVRREEDLAVSPALFA